MSRLGNNSATDDHNLCYKEGTNSDHPTALNIDNWFLIANYDTIRRLT